jgi:hypothetical protein
MPAMVPASVCVILASLLGLWTRLIDSQRALVQEHAVHRSDSLLSVLRFCHLYEGESAYLVGVAVLDNRDRLDCSINGEYRPKLLFRHGRIQIADKDVIHLAPFFKKQTKGGAVSAASRQLSLEWANVFRLPPLRSFGDIELHRLALLQALKPTRLDRRKMHENVLARLAADKPVAFGVVEPLYCSLFHDVAAIPFNRFVLERDSEVLAAELLAG